MALTRRTRVAIAPAQQGRVTATAAVGAGATGGGVAALLTYYVGMPPEIAVIIGSAVLLAWAYFAGVAGTWARDQLGAGQNGFWLRLLAGLGAVALCWSLSGCAIDAWGLKAEIWDTASLEIELDPFGSLCLGCYENAAPESAVVEEAPAGGVVLEPMPTEVLVRGRIVPEEPQP